MALCYCSACWDYRREPPHPALSYRREPPHPALSYQPLPQLWEAVGLKPHVLSSTGSHLGEGSRRRDRNTGIKEQNPGRQAGETGTFSLLWEEINKENVTGTNVFLNTDLLRDRRNKK